MTIVVKTQAVKKIVGKQVQEQVPAEPAQAQKPKQAPPAQAQVTHDVLTQSGDSIIVKVDLMAELNAELVAMKPKHKQFDEAKKFLQSIADEDGDPAQPVEILGSNGNKVIYSAKCDQSLITNKKGLLEALKSKFIEAAGGDHAKGFENLLELVSLPLGELPKYFSESELAKYITKTQATGPRTLKAVIKGTE